jgi:hypothetical protein
MHNNLLDISSWTVGSGTISGGGGYAGNYFLSVGDQYMENIRYYDLDPWNKQGIIWEAMPIDGGSGGGGGFLSGYIPIDINYDYRLSVWTKRTVVSGQVTSDYFGTYARDSSKTNTSFRRLTDNANVTNPYFGFYNGDEGGFGEWIFRVAHVRKANHVDSGFHEDEGGWSQNGTKLFNNDNRFALKSDIVWIRLRAFYYEDQPPDYKRGDLRQRWIYPRIDKCDGTQPSLESLLRNQTFYTTMKVGGKFFKFKYKDVLRN